MSQPYPVPIPLPQPKSRPLPDSRGIPDTLNLTYCYLLDWGVKSFFIKWHTYVSFPTMQWDFISHCYLLGTLSPTRERIANKILLENAISELKSWGKSHLKWGIIQKRQWVTPLLIEVVRSSFSNVCWCWIFHRDCGILEWNPVPFPIPSRTRIPSRYWFSRDTGWGLVEVL